MSTERDELANLVGNVCEDVVYVNEIADAILAAGYRKPQQVTTVEELDALPAASVARGWAVGGRTMYLRVVSGRGRLVWGCVGSSQCYESADLLKEGTTATVLHVGGAE